MAGLSTFSDNNNLMIKYLATALLTFILSNSFCQAGKLTTYLSAEYNNTIYDKTKANNPWGMGPGLQSRLNNATRFAPTLELTADFYLEDDKVLRTINNIPLQDVRHMINLFAGSSFAASNKLFISFVAGPSFISGGTFLGIKPSVDIFFSKDNRFTAKAYYINVFKREKISGSDFGTVGVAFGVRLL